MEQVTLNRETYDKLMDIELIKDKEIDRLKDVIEELESGCVSVRVTDRETMFYTVEEIYLLANDEKLKAIEEEMLYQITDADKRSENYKESFKEKECKIYNRNILQRIFNKRV